MDGKNKFSKEPRKKAKHNLEEKRRLKQKKKQGSTVFNITILFKHKGHDGRQEKKP